MQKTSFRQRFRNTCIVQCQEKSSLEVRLAIAVEPKLFSMTSIQCCTLLCVSAIRPLLVALGRYITITAVWTASTQFCILKACQLLLLASEKRHWLLHTAFTAFTVVIVLMIIFKYDSSSTAVKTAACKSYGHVELCIQSTHALQIR